MGLVDQHQVGALDGVGLPVHRLDAGEQDLRLGVPPVQPGAVDPGRRLGPEADELGEVLADQLTDVGQNDDPLVRPLRQHLLDEGPENDRLPAVVVHDEVGGEIEVIAI